MKKTIFVNLNFDDFHPESSSYGDFGGTPGKGTFLKLSALCEQFPGLVITLFTSPNWIDRPQTQHRYFYYIREKLGLLPVVQSQPGNPYLLSKHPDWCNAVIQMVEKNQFEIAVHGYEHYNPRSRIHGQEFCGLDEKETKERIVLAESELAKMNIPFLKAFRPPGWGTNPFLSKVLKELEYEIYALESSRSKTSAIGEREGLKTIPQNWSIRESKEEALRLAEEQGIVFMKGHLTYAFGTEIIENGITENFWLNLIDTLHELQEKYDVTFVSMRHYLDIKGN